jgi:general secretion pathway protein G
MEKKFCHTKGFTVVELLVVISIIMLLITLIIPNLSNAKKKARVARAKAEISALETAITAYYSDMGHYPTNDVTKQTETDNTIIITQLSGRQGGSGAFDTTVANNADWNGPYMEFDAEHIKGGAYIDPWGTPYEIEINLNGDVNASIPEHNRLTFDIRSDGPDKASKTTDDITNY